MTLVNQPKSDGCDDDQIHAHEAVSEYQDSYTGLLSMLQNLDQRLAAAISVAEGMFAARAAGDLYRGLAISPADVAAALSKTPGQPLLPISAQIQPLSAISDSLSLRRLLWLQRVYGLTNLDLDAMLVALAPEIELRYERLYAYLQDDVTKRRPSIDLALNLLCSTAAEKLRQRERFAPDAPLIKHRLIEIYADPHHPKSPLLAHYFRLDEQIVRFLLLDDSLDSRLADFCHIEHAKSDEHSAPLPDDIRNQIQGIAAQKPDTGIRLYFQGPEHCGQDEAAALLAKSLGFRHLKADLTTKTIINSANEILPVLVREAWFRSALLHVNIMDSPDEANTSIQQDGLWEALKVMPTNCVIEGSNAWITAPNKPLGVVTITFEYPAIEQRKKWWRQCLSTQGLTANGEIPTELANRYRMTYAQIRSAAASAAVMTRADQAHSSDTAAKSEDFIAPILFSASRVQFGHELAKLTTKIEPRATWSDLVLPQDQIAQLQEICDRCTYKDKVLNEWGFAKKLSYGLGTAALFSGSSGTGKTMAAEVIANALKLDLYRIDLSQIVNKYIGETEKNLNKIFTAAENANAILFFDEADALFGKRSEIKDSHDRYANLEISYLLQKMEQFEGITILATNLRQNLDDAFLRRLTFTVHFPFPDETHRRRIWGKVWPDAKSLAVDINLNELAQQLKLSGGNIKNIAHAAAFLGAAEGEQIKVQHVMHAAVREYKKDGKNLV